MGDPDKNEGPVRIRYELLEVSLDAWTPGTPTWRTVARKAAPGLPPNAAGVENLFGSWAPTPPMPYWGWRQQGDKTKLFLWSKNPYYYVRHGGREWGDWANTRFGDDPVRTPRQTEQCWTLISCPSNRCRRRLSRLVAPKCASSRIPTNRNPRSHGRKPEYGVSGRFSRTVWHGVKALCLPGQYGSGLRGLLNYLLIRLPPGPNRGVRIHCQAPQGALRRGRGCARCCACCVGGQAG